MHKEELQKKQCLRFRGSHNGYFVRVSGTDPFGEYCPGGFLEFLVQF